MSKTKYLIRLDDACPTMNHEKWGRMEDILDKYGVKPMVGVIPHNEDTKQQIDPENDYFWSMVHNWEKKGWTIAMHGYNHVYSSKEGGMNPMWKKSEFAGHPLDMQREKIKKGVEIFREKGFNPQYFFAPSHTFDENTLEALRQETDIRIISDTFATRPYYYKGFLFIPQFGGQCRKMILPGYYTFCFHPSTMTEEAFVRIEKFLHSYSNHFISFDALELSVFGKKTIFDKFLTTIYFTLRKLKNHES